jgi:hypothetical protein
LKHEETVRIQSVLDDSLRRSRSCIAQERRQAGLQQLAATLNRSQ